MDSDQNPKLSFSGVILTHVGSFSCFKLHCSKKVCGRVGEEKEKERGKVGGRGMQDTGFQTKPLKKLHKEGAFFLQYTDTADTRLNWRRGQFSEKRLSGF